MLADRTGEATDADVIAKAGFNVEVCLRQPVVSAFVCKEVVWH